MADCDICANENVTDTERQDPLFRRIVWFALVSNGVMFVVEFIASIISGSVSLQADAIDFFADAVNYGIT